MVDHFGKEYKPAIPRQALCCPVCGCTPVPILADGTGWFRWKCSCGFDIGPGTSVRDLKSVFRKLEGAGYYLIVDLHCDILAYTHIDNINGVDCCVITHIIPNRYRAARDLYSFMRSEHERFNIKDLKSFLTKFKKRWNPIKVSKHDVYCKHCKNFVGWDGLQSLLHKGE